MQREKAIRTIDSAIGGFSPAAFVSSAKEKVANIALPDAPSSGDFTFGTALEKKSESSNAQPPTAKEKFLADLEREGLCHPNLFGDEKEREAKWIRYLFNLRREALLKGAAPAKQ